MKGIRIHGKWKGSRAQGENCSRQGETCSTISEGGILVEEDRAQQKDLFENLLALIATRIQASAPPTPHPEHPPWHHVLHTIPL